MALAIGLVPFTVQYVCLRAFYALEDTRSTFFLQCVIAAANVVFGIAVVMLFDRPALVATGLGLAYSLAYAIGVLVSFRRLRRKLPDLNGEALVRHCIRLIVAVAPAAAVAWLIVWLFTGWSGSRLVLALGLVVGSLVAVLMFLVAARLLRIREVTDIVATLRRRGGATGPTGEPLDRRNRSADPRPTRRFADGDQRLRVIRSKKYPPPQWHPCRPAARPRTQTRWHRRQ